MKFIFKSIAVTVLVTITTGAAMAACETPRTTKVLIQDIDTYINRAYDGFRDPETGVLCGDKNRVKIFGVDYYPDVDESLDDDVLQGLSTSFTTASRQIADEVGIGFDADMAYREFLFSFPSTVRSDVLVRDSTYVKERLKQLQDILRRSRYSCSDNNVYVEAKVQYYVYRQAYIWMLYGDELLLPEDVRYPTQAGLTDSQFRAVQERLSQLYTVIREQPSGTPNLSYNPLYTEVYTEFGAASCALDPLERKVQSSFRLLMDSFGDVSDEVVNLGEAAVSTASLLWDDLSNPVETISQAIRTRGRSLQEMRFTLVTNYSVFTRYTETTTRGEEFVSQRDQVQDTSGPIEINNQTTSNTLVGQYSQSRDSREELERRKDDAVAIFYLGQTQSFSGEGLGTRIISQVFEKIQAQLAQGIIADLRNAGYDMTRICKAHQPSLNDICE